MLQFLVKSIKCVHQGFVLRPLLFNIHLSYSFYLRDFTEVCNFADGTTFQSCNNDLRDLIKKLEHGAFWAIKWLETNKEIHKGKCHLLLSLKMEDEKIWETAKQTLLKMRIRKNLNFDGPVFSLCERAGRKLIVLVRLFKFTSFKQKWILMKAFVNSQFGYCPLIWMFHSSKLNSKINLL